MKTFQVFLDEASLSFGEIQKYDWRVALFLKKLKSHEPFELNDGGVTTLTYPNDELEKMVAAGKAPGRSYTIPTNDGKSIKFSALKKTKQWGGGSGSGGGAANTTTTESAQCVYCQAIWDNPATEFSPDDIKAAYQKVHVDAKLKDVLEMDDAWKVSSINAARLLYKGLKKKKYEFHRGVGFQRRIEQIFHAVNGGEGKPFNNINKWTPADIWMVAVGAEKKYDFNEARSLQYLNNELLKAFAARDVLGISLKKIKGKAKLKQVNFRRPFKAPVFEKITLGKRDYWKSKDGYIIYNGGSIQFRTFPIFQCEITGKVAKHGKISGGAGPNSIMGKIMKKVGAEPHEMQKNVAALFKSNKLEFIKRWYKMYLRTDEKQMSQDEFIAMVGDRESNWCISKYLATQVLTNIRGREQAFLADIIRYAKSESKDSAVHLKVHVQ